MKKLIILLIAVAFNSCSGSSDSQPIAEADLIATWILQSHTIDGDELGNSHDHVSFYANHRVKVTYPSNPSVMDNGDWSLSGNNLTITWDEADAGMETYHLQILNLTDTKLKWKTTISGEGVLIENYVKE